MKVYFTPLLQLQRFFLPALILLFLWATWRTIWKKDLAVGLGLYIGLVIIVDGYLNTGIFLPGLEKGSIRYSEACAGFLLFSRPKATPRQSPYGAVCFFVGLYFSLLAISAFRTAEPMASFMEFRRLIIPQIIALAIAIRGLHSAADYRRLFMCMMVLTLIIAAFVFFDLFFEIWLLKSDMLFTPEYSVNRAHQRFGSFFLNPNYLGAFVVLTFPAAAGWALNESMRFKLFGGVGLLALVFCLVETQSRGPLLAMGIVIVLLLLGPAGEMSRTRRIGLFLPFVALLVLLMPGFFEHASGRFDQIEQEMTTETARTRQTIWMYTGRAIADHPLTGIGFGERQFLRVINQDYGFEEEYGESSLDNPHNSYLQMTVYGGIPVLISFLLANLLMLFKAARTILKKGTGQPLVVAFGLAVGLAGFLTVIYPDMHMFTQTVAPVYWVYFGLLFSIATATEASAVAVEPYEDSRSHIGNAGQRLAGQPADRTPRYRRDRHRAPAAGVDLRRQSRAAEEHDSPVRAAAHGEQAPVQPAALAPADGVRGANGQREPLARWRDTGLRQPGAFFGGRQRQ